MIPVGTTKNTALPFSDHAVTEEIAHRIFGHLPWDQLPSLFCVSKVWREFLGRHIQWRKQVGKPIPISKAEANDPQGAAWQQLLRARSSGSIELMATEASAVAKLYLGKEDYLRAIYLINTAIAWREDAETNCDDLYELLAGSCETHIRNKIDKDYKGPLRLPLAQYRAQLRATREIASKMLVSNSEYEVEEGLALVSRHYRNLLGQLVSASVEILGQVPIEFEVLVLGSLARNEPCRNSDVEWAIILKENRPEYLPYFRHVAELVDLFALCLGDTRFRPSDASMRQTDDGYRIDSGGALNPLGIKGTFELIGSPADLAAFQNSKRSNDMEVLQIALCSVGPLADGGRTPLLDSYLGCVKAELGGRFGYKQQLRRRALHLLEGHLSAYRSKLDRHKEQQRGYSVKEEWYRPLHLIVDALAMYYLCPATSTFDRVEYLRGKKVITCTGSEHLRSALRTVLALRWRVHSYHESHVDWVALPGSSSSQSSDYQLSEEELRRVYDVFRTLHPLRRLANQFVRETTAAEKQMARDNLYVDSSLADGETALELGEYKTALSHFQTFVSSNMNSPAGYLAMSRVYEAMGKPNDQRERAQKALKAIEAIHPTPLNDKAEALSLIGRSYQMAHDGDLADRWLGKAIKVWDGEAGQGLPAAAASTVAALGHSQRHSNPKEACNRYEEALSLYKNEKLQWREMIPILVDLAEAYADLNLNQNALDSSQRAIDLHNRYGSARSALKITVCLSRVKLLERYDAIAMNDEALSYLREAQEAAKLLYPEERHPLRLRCMEVTADTLYLIRDERLMQSAMSLYSGLLKIIEAEKVEGSRLPQNVPDLMRVREKLAMVCGSLSKSTESILHFTHAWIIGLESGLRVDCDVMIRLQLLRMIATLEDHGSKKQSVEEIKEQFDLLTDSIESRYSDQPHRNVFLYHAILSSVYDSNGHIPLAIEHGFTGIKVARQLYGKSHSHLRGALRSQARLLAGAGKKEEAVECYEEIHQIERSLAKEIGTEAMLAYFYLDYGAFLKVLLEQPQRAYEIWESSLSCAVRADEHEWVDKAVIGLHWIKSENDSIDTKMEWVSKAHEFYLRHKGKFSEARIIALQYLTDDAQRREDVESYCKYSEQIVELHALGLNETYVTISEDLRLAHLLDLVDILLELKDKKKVVRYAKMGLVWCARLAKSEDWQTTLDALIFLAKALATSGDKRTAAEAGTMALKTFQVVTKSPNYCAATLNQLNKGTNEDLSTAIDRLQTIDKYTKALEELGELL